MKNNGATNGFGLPPGGGELTLMPDLVVVHDEETIATDEGASEQPQGAASEQPQGASEQPQAVVQIEVETTRVLDGAIIPAQPDALDYGSAPVGTRIDDIVVKVSVVIPALNEAKNLPPVLTRLPDGLHQVILVDGYSVDDTVDVARSLRSDIEVVLQRRRGKGNAMAHGFAAVTGDVVVMLDADGSADPAEIPDFVAALVEQGADFAKGSRFCRGGGSSDITPLRRAGNHALGVLVNVLFGTRYTDLCYGYNAFWTRMLPVLDLPDITAGSSEPVWGDGFEIETLINLRMARAGAIIREVPSFEHPRLHGVSNLNTMRDGVRVLRTIVRERIPASRRRRVTATRATLPLAARR
jgi:Glycosyl transferase family 2